MMAMSRGVRRRRRLGCGFDPHAALAPRSGRGVRPYTDGARI